MIVFTVVFDEDGFKVFTDLGEYSRQSADCECGQNISAVFGNEDQMNMKIMPNRLSKLPLNEPIAPFTA